MAHQKDITPFMDRTCAFLEEENNKLNHRLEKLPWIKTYPSRTPFSLLQLLPDCSAERLCAVLLTKRLVIRNCANFHGLPNQFVRISLKSEQHNAKLAQVLTQVDPGQL
jgi:threonine-phosphate decarboxylase